MRTRSTFLIVVVLILVLDVKALELKIKMSEFGNQKYNFSLVGFLDCRLHKLTPVGYTRNKEKENGVEGITLPGVFANYCDTVFHSPNLSYDTSLVLMPVINQITVQETHDARYGYSIVSLAIDYYQVFKDSCSLYYRSYVRINQSTMLAVSKLHSSSLADAFLESFDKLRNFINMGIIPFDERKVTIASVKEKQNENWKTFKLAKKLKDGIYFSSKQLLQNEPSLNYPKLIAKVDTSFLAMGYNKKNNFFQVNSFYALVKDHELYIQLEDRIYHKCVLERGTNLVYFKDLNSEEAHMSTPAKSRSVFIGAQFGLLGALVVETINASIRKAPVSSKDVLYIDLESGLIDINP